MKNIDPLMAFLVSLIFIALIFAVYKDNEFKEYKKSCQKMNGHALRLDSGDICLDKKHFVEVQ